MATYNIVMMGAAYGSLLASKMLFGGHKIHHICLPAEADLINAEGFRVRLPVRGRKDPVLLDSRKLPGKVTAGGTTSANPADYDLIGLAMQEPQYRSPGVRELLDAVAKSGKRCITKDGMRTAQEAVHSDIETSRSVYNCVNDLCVKLGANPNDLVPFEKYAAAAQSLVRPASAARALNNGVPYIERADKLVQLIAKQKGLSHPVIDAGVALVDARLEANRKKAAA